MIGKAKEKSVSPEASPKYPGILEAMDGSAAVVEMETAASEAAGAYPITPSTQMGEGWALAVAAGKTNVNGRRLIFFEPEGEHAAAGVTAGMSMVGLRSTNFSSGQGIAYMHESLYAAAGKRLTYVLNVAARAMTKQALNVHAGHDDYHSVDDTGFFQLFAKDVQQIADFTLIAHRIAELSLNPGISAQDGFLTSHVIETLRLPEPELVREYLGDPADIIDSPTPAQRMVFGDKRRRIPELFDLDYPALFGSVQNQYSYAQGVAAQRPFYFDHVQDLTDQALEEFGNLTGRRYARAMGYRLEDAEWVLAGQGSVIPNAEAVADHLRDQGIKVGVLNLTMFRPFPADLVSHLLAGKKGVTVLERVDQPLAVDPPILREIRAAMAKAVENGRAARAAAKPGKNGGKGKRALPTAGLSSELPFPGLAALEADDVPDFYAGGYGFGSRDLQPGDLIAAVNNMGEGGRRQRHFYLGFDFIRKGTTMPKLQIWQEQLLEAYPRLGDLSLESAGDLNLMPSDAISLRIHSVGGWGAITMGKNVAITAHELAGFHIKANPKYGSEKKGQPTTFYATLSKEVIRLNAELKHVDIVLSPDPNVFRNSDPLAGLSEGGAFVIQSDQDPATLWDTFPAEARRTIVQKKIRVYALDAFKIASEEASDPDLRYRMQGTAFMGAFFRTSPVKEREGLDDETLIEGIRKQLQKKFGHRGEHVVEDNLRVIRRGFLELMDVPHGDVGEDEPGAHAMPHIPRLLDTPEAEPGLANPGRFWEQVCAFCAVSKEDMIADPFAALSAIPAATSTVRDMTNIRFEVPDFIPEKCTGCSQCWMQCPDAAIPGLVTPVEDVFETAIRAAQNGRSFNRLQQIAPHLSRESRKIMKGVPFKTFGEVATAAYANVVEKLGWDAERRAAVDEEWSHVFPVLDEFPFAKVAPFFDLPERKQKGTGGLLSITVNPEACKGCNICVDVCPEGALITVKQTDDIVDRLRRNWDFWEELPDTDDRFVNITDLEEGIGVLSSLLLKKDNYRTMAGGDGACMGCGEKTAVHILVSTIEGVMQPRVKNLVEKLDGMLEELDAKMRGLLASGADLDLDALVAGGHADLPVDEAAREKIDRLSKARKELKDLRWRYLEGPSGKGRSPMGISNSTGCSSVWGSTYPYNPYPFPWVNHLFQDAPSVAIGIFEGQMRKMADNFISVRKARLLLDDQYDPARDDPFFQAFDWKQFSDEEFNLCPPILAMGGDGAMLDIGFQNLSRLLASGKPVRVVVLDTQVYSNTGGQSCTSGFTGQVADMAGFGKAQHGKTEARKELALIGMAHRGSYVLQTSQAAPNHMISGIIRGLHYRGPSVFNIYTPCPVEHGVADEWALHSARLALESRAFPFVIYDPEAGRTFADCVDLEGNPAVEDQWPVYDFKYRDEEGNEQVMELPLSTADWAATEGRFSKHFWPIKPEDWDDDDQVLYHEYMGLSSEDRRGKTPFIFSHGENESLARLGVSQEMVLLGEDRLLFWSQLKELAGVEVPESVRDTLTDELEEEFEVRAAAIRQEFEAQMAQLRATYPGLIARKMAEGLLGSGAADMTVAQLLQQVQASGVQAVPPSGEGAVAVAPPPAAPPAAAPAAAPPVEAPAAPAPAAPEPEEEDDDELAMEPYVETARCTSCNECTNLNPKLFAYDENKQAYIKDPRGGPFSDIVKAAERCPAAIIHPGTPLNPKEKDLDKWIKRAEPFN
jgi:pyruvate-ferredoxin/flavodoxin oxidoreductase